MSKAQAARLAVDDLETQLREELENAARLRRTRRVVVAGDEHDVRFGQLAAQTAELQERVENRLIGRAHAVKHIARDDDHVGPKRDDPIDGHAKRSSDVRLPLVDPAGSQPLILPVAEVEIREMDQAHNDGWASL